MKATPNTAPLLTITLDTLHDFFDNCPPDECLRLLNEMRDAALVAHHTSFDNADKRRYLICFCRELGEALEAAGDVIKRKIA